MKQKIHPQYYDNCEVTCACGNTFTTGSTLPKIQVEICSNCHPFFTGEMKYVDTLGRVEKFKQKQSQLKGKKYLAKTKRRQLKAQLEEKEAKNKPKTLKEMLQSKYQKK